MAMLVNAPPAQAKQRFGEHLYAMIQRDHGPLAGKITGMLLEGLGNTELVILITDENELRSKVAEALNTIEAYTLRLTLSRSLSRSAEVDT